LGSAKTIVTISPAMLEKVRARFPGNERNLRLIPNWIHGSLQAEIGRQEANSPSREIGQLFYSGNLGVKQGLHEFLADFIDLESNWCLTIHGGGTELERLRPIVQDADNVKLGVVLAEPDYVAALLKSSACLITQRPGVGANFLPSKLLPALATGTPVLAVCDPHSPLGHEVTAGGFGAVIPPGDASALAKTLEAWRANPEILAGMSRKAYERAPSYSKERVLPLYEHELSQLLVDRS
jgi:colanic acid biosynthesis glycosyl transferase WcaI